MFIIINQSIKISTNETIMLCSLLYLVFISIYLYNIILFKIHNEFDEVDYGINSIMELIHLLLYEFTCVYHPDHIIMFALSDWNPKLWVPYYNTDKIHRIYNNFPWNLDKRVHLNLL